MPYGGIGTYVGLAGLVKRHGYHGKVHTSRGEQTCKCQRRICSACRNFDPVAAERLRRRDRSEDSAAGAEWRQ